MTGPPTRLAADRRRPSQLWACSSPAPPPRKAANSEKYALESVSASLSTNQAGAHADFTADFALNEKEGEPYAYTSDILVSLPPGFIGNPQKFPRCTLAQLGGEPAESECPQDSQIGISEVTLGGEHQWHPGRARLQHGAPGGDIVARFGLFAGPYPSVINVRVNPIDYSLVASVEGHPRRPS